MSISETPDEAGPLLLSPRAQPRPPSVPMAASHEETDTGPSSTFAALSTAADPATVGKRLKIKREVLNRCISTWQPGHGWPRSRGVGKYSTREVVVLGKIRGNIDTSARVDIRIGASLTGNVSGYPINIGDGASFKGGVDIKPGPVISIY